MRQQLSSYPVSIDIVTRFSDTDPQHHINNVAVAEFYQEARLEFHRTMADEFLRPEGSRVLVVHHEMDYLAEIQYPGVVIVGVGISRIGSTSYTFGAGMFQDGKCVGLASTVLVNANAQGPTPLHPEMRAFLEKRLLPA
jgi:acyl-CoA thioester hydrolase